MPGMATEAGCSPVFVLQQVLSCLLVTIRDAVVVLKEQNGESVVLQNNDLFVSAHALLFYSRPDRKLVQL